MPAEAVEALGGGKRPKVQVTINGYSYPSSIATVAGRHMVPVSAEVRAAAAVAAGDEVEVELVLDLAPRTVSVPQDLANALAAAPAATASVVGQDTLSTTYGMRSVAVQGATLTMNGRPLFLKGVNWHEETPAHGRSMTIPEYNRLLGRVLQAHANFIRNSVYNRHPYVYDWADEHGVLVMDEYDTMWLHANQEQLQTDSYGLARAEALATAWDQANHPSVIL